jgi:hypothetical protein
MARVPADLLGQFRRKPQGSGASAVPEPSIQPGGLKPYNACKVSTHPASLAIFPMLGPAHNPSYSYLFNVSWDDEIFETVVLFFTFMQVNIRGRNLASVVDALRLRKCEYVREFHPREHQLPAEGEAMIDSIELVVKNLPTALGESVLTHAAK